MQVPPTDATRESQRSVWLGRLRLAATFGLILGMVALAKPTPVGVTVGFLIAAAGEAIRIWAAGYLRKSVELVTAGPYRHLRHPLYLGRLLIFTGLCWMASLPYHANLIVLAVGYIVFFGYYLPRKERVEPARLAAIHGEAYRRYHDAVPTLVPRGRPYAGGFSAGWSSHRMVRNREHWMVVGLLALTVFLLWRAYPPS